MILGQEIAFESYSDLEGWCQEMAEAGGGKGQCGEPQPAQSWPACTDSDPSPEPGGLWPPLRGASQLTSQDAFASVLQVGSLESFLTMDDWASVHLKQ